MSKYNTAEHNRLKTSKENNPWKNWGPFLTERQWGTVREDYSADGSAWEHTTHDMARSYTYRWGEEGIAGISDNKSLLCFSVALWNGKDPVLKERLFGMTGNQGNHGEDVKELYYYLDSTPTHSYMKMLYKYPQAEFPYQKLIDGNQRSRHEPEYELIDTGVFDEDKYFDVFVEYAKGDMEDILIKISVVNRGPEEAEITVLPTLWFRNIWTWGYDFAKPKMAAQKDGSILIEHDFIGKRHFYSDQADRLLFCENESNNKRLYNKANKYSYCKDGINDYVVNDNTSAVNMLQREGTKASSMYKVKVKPGETKVVRTRLTDKTLKKPFEDFDQIFSDRLREANEFYDEVQHGVKDEELRLIQRQGYAGMMWCKQFFYFNVQQWLDGDPIRKDTLPESRKKGRNSHWEHLNNSNVISMPDKWEYPWYAAWDLAFHCIPIAQIDPDFAKRQLTILLREYYMHPNGQIPAYEWNFGDVNPPVHAWATWRVYELDKERNNGVGDTAFLERILHKLTMNFTWWVNQKDKDGKNIFEGGFLGLDNIGVFDRSQPLPIGGRTEQSDGTSWMAMYSLNMLRISTELALKNPVYQDLASKYFEHFLYIAGAMNNIGDSGVGLWDEEDQFYFDIIHLPNGKSQHLKVKSIVGIIPLFAVEVLTKSSVDQLPDFKRRLEWILLNRPDLASQVSRWTDVGDHNTKLLSLLRGHRMTMVLKRMLNETEFLSDFGIRALSKEHEAKPYEFNYHGKVFSVVYKPAESDSAMFGGNSNWRGPIWFPINYMIVESLMKFHSYYGDEFVIEYPTGSGKMLTLKDIAGELSNRLINIFRLDKKGKRPVNGDVDKFSTDPHFKDLISFYEFFHGDNGRGCGASHQTGWTGLVATLIHEFKREE
ncbi:MGH1-like glycoside hydrolase domain-containing protein [Cytophaga aurantiaca]|uniref:MGH1-like glycoside hydrolase domain-containing protein n=1 Tax=Cytophaga aurantiaca TaxID=29530 RepID=UPI000364610F|nr:glucosidase [Cytophaga aurantiaca]